MIRLSPREYEAWYRLGFLIFEMSGFSLPDDDQYLADHAADGGVSPEDWAAMKPAVMQFFALHAGRWRPLLGRAYDARRPWEWEVVT